MRQRREKNTTLYRESNPNFEVVATDFIDKLSLFRNNIVYSN
jgi:hypothetical protein